MFATSFVRMMFKTVELELAIVACVWPLPQINDTVALAPAGREPTSRKSIRGVEVRRD